MADQEPVALSEPFQDFQIHQNQTISLLRNHDRVHFQPIQLDPQPLLLHHVKAGWYFEGTDVLQSRIKISNILMNIKDHYPIAAQQWVTGDRRFLDFSPSHPEGHLLTPAHLLPINGQIPQYIADNTLAPLTRDTTLNPQDIIFLPVRADMVFRCEPQGGYDIPIIIWPCRLLAEGPLKLSDLSIILADVHIQLNVPATNIAWVQALRNQENQDQYGRVMNLDLGLNAFANTLGASITRFHTTHIPTQARRHTLIISCPQRSMGGKTTACLQLGQKPDFALAMICLSHSFESGENPISNIGKIVRNLIDSDSDFQLRTLLRMVILKAICDQQIDIFDVPEEILSGDQVLPPDSRTNIVLVIDEILTLDKVMNTRRSGKYLVPIRREACMALESIVGQSLSTITLVLLDTTAAVGNFAFGAHPSAPAHTPAPTHRMPADVPSLEAERGGFSRHRMMLAFESTVDSMSAREHFVAHTGTRIDDLDAQRLSGPPLFLTTAIGEFRKIGRLDLHSIRELLERLAYRKLGVTRSMTKHVPPHIPPLFVRNSVLTVFGGIVGRLSAGLNEDLVRIGPGRLIIPTSLTEGGLLPSTMPQAVLIASPRHTERSFTSAAAKLLCGRYIWRSRDEDGGIDELVHNQDISYTKALQLSSWHAFQALVSPFSSNQRLGGGRGSWGEHMSLFLTMFPLLGGDLRVPAWAAAVETLTKTLGMKCDLIWLNGSDDFQNVTLGQCSSVVDSGEGLSLEDCRRGGHLVFYGKNESCPDHFIPCSTEEMTYDLVVETRARENWHRKLRSRFVEGVNSRVYDVDDHERRTVNVMMLIAPESDTLTYFSNPRNDDKIKRTMTKYRIDLIFHVRTPDFTKTGFTDMMKRWMARLPPGSPWQDLFRAMLEHTAAHHGHKVCMTRDAKDEFKEAMSLQQLTFGVLWYTQSLGEVTLVDAGMEPATMEIYLLEGRPMFHEL